MYKKKLIILDLNLRNLGGHGYKYNTEVAKSAENKFSTTIIYHHPIFVPPNNLFNFKSLSCLFFYDKLENSSKTSSLKIKKSPKHFRSRFFKEIKFTYKFLNSLFYSIIVLFKEYKNNYEYRVQIGLINSKNSDIISSDEFAHLRIVKSYFKSKNHYFTISRDDLAESESDEKFCKENNLKTSKIIVFQNGIQTTMEKANSEYKY